MCAKLIVTGILSCVDGLSSEADIILEFTKVVGEGDKGFGG